MNGQGGVRGFILAAGRGVRMGPLGQRVPKPLWPLGGLPLIGFALHKLRLAGVREVGINLHHGAEAIRAALGDRPSGLVARFFFEPEILGTAGGLKNAEGFLRETGEPFFVLNADAPCGADLGEALAHHLRGGFLATLVLRESPDAGRYGMLAADEAGRLRRFLRAQAPGAPQGRLTEAMFTGMSVLSPGILDRIPAGRPCGIAEEIYPRLIEEGMPLGAVLTRTGWADVGTPERFLAAQEDLLAGRFVPEFPWPGGDHVLASGPPSGWGEGRIEPPVLLSGEARLERGAIAGPFSIVMRGATLLAGASIARSVMFPGARAASGVRLDQCIVGPEALAAPPGGEARRAVFLAGDGRPIPFGE
ncbi:MAG: NDP-sugar synthase [Candidatus Tectomicrobia bacterium]|nr:NDP-sugar synthase [Candidatus Tectomicrobia bacterium]